MILDIPAVRYLITLILMMASAVVSAAPPTTLPIEDFGQFDGPSGRWRVSPAVHISAIAPSGPGGRAMRFRLSSGEEGGTGDEVRRATLQLDKPIDLSEYSRLCFDVTSRTAGFVTVSCTLYEPKPTPREGWQALLRTVASHQAATVSFDLNRLIDAPDASVDLSRIQTIALGAGMRRYDPIVYDVDNLRAEYDPAVGSPAQHLREQAGELKREYQAIGSQVDWNAIPADQRQELRRLAAAEIAELDSILSGAGSFGERRARLISLREANRIGRLLLTGRQGLYLWNISPYVNVYPDEKPRAAATPLEKIDVSMARGEYRDFVFMVSSVDRAREARVTLKSEAAELVKTTLVQEALYVKDAAGESVGDAHFPLQDSRLSIPAGQSRQVRLRFDATEAGLAPGRHEFQLMVEDPADRTPPQTIQGAVEVWNFQLPGHEILSNNAYCEFEGNTLAGMEEAMVRDMKAYGLNVFFVRAEDVLACVGKGQAFNLDLLDRYIDFIMKAWGQGPPPQFILSLWGHAPPAGEGLREWLERISAIMDRHGLDHRHWFMVFADEVDEDGLMGMELPNGETLKRAAPEVAITSNSSAILNDLSAAIRYLKTLDRREPDWDIVSTNPYLLDYMRLSDKPIALYRCRGDWTRHGANMYDYYRVYAWHAIANGATGLGVWTYNADRRADPWKGPANLYSLVLKHPSGRAELVHTRRYETYREGIDDYRYVWKLRQEAQRQGSQAQQEAEAMIRQAIADITQHPADTTRCEAWRRKIARQILEWNR